MDTSKNIGVYSNSVSLDNYYNEIKKHLFLKAEEEKNKNKFEELKLKFVIHVNSNRRMCGIEDIESLVEVLQKRNEIHVSKTELLEQMFDFYNIDKNLIHEHNQFLSSLQTNRPGTIKKVNIYALELQNSIPLGREFCNSESNTLPRNTDQFSTPTICHNCDSQRQKSRGTQPLHQEFHSLPPEPSCSKVYPSKSSEDNISTKYELPERVIEILCTVGWKWRELARHLSLTQGRIDEIESKHTLSIENRIRMVLEEYQQNCKKDLNEENINAGLLKALKGIKRNDLLDQVDKYLTRYYARNRRY